MKFLSIKRSSRAFAAMNTSIDSKDSTTNQGDTSNTGGVVDDIEIPSNNNITKSTTNAETKSNDDGNDDDPPAINTTSNNCETDEASTRDEPTTTATGDETSSIGGDGTNRDAAATKEEAGPATATTADTLCADNNVDKDKEQQQQQRQLDLAASKTFQEEEDEYDDERNEPVVELNISMSGEPFIVDEGETTLSDGGFNTRKKKKKSSRWDALRRGGTPSKLLPSIRGSAIKKLPTTVSTWAKDVPQTLKGWTRREKILLCIAILNALIIFALLGSNMSMMKRNRRSQTLLSASTRGDENGPGGDKPKKEGKGKGKNSKDDADVAVGGDDSTIDDTTTDDESSPPLIGGWTVSTNTSGAGGSAVVTPNNTNTNPTPPTNGNGGENNGNSEPNPPGTTSGNNNAAAPVNPPQSTPTKSPTQSAPVPTSTTNQETTNQKPTSTSTTTTTTTVTQLGDPDELCGCATCTESIWNQLAGSDSCGDRILYLQSEFPMQYPTQVHACRRVAFEFPCICGGCDPGRCSIPTPEFVLPDDWKPSTTNKFGAAITPAPTPIPAVTDPNLDHENQILYCYPSPENRQSYTLWDGMIVQPKEDAGVCGPGNNMFTSSNVIVDETADTLMLVYTQASASEVRILLPKERRPYTYGTYSFSVASVAVKDETGAVVSNVLPKELVLGLFTWDDTENYAVHENFNHEVDIEVSRWNCEENSDLQYLVQPPGFPQMHRLFTGNAAATTPQEKYKQGGQVYEFEWKPAQIDWTSTAGETDNRSFSLKSEEAVYRDLPDFVQCAPDVGGNMEVRINIWNMLGAASPSGLSASARVEVVFDNFSFVPSGETYVPDGGICTKHCQCNMETSECIHNVCTAL